MSLVAVAARPGMVSFSTGLPDNSLFDSEALVRATEDVMSEDPCGALQYDLATGYRPLRERIARRCRDVLGFETSWENVLMTSGSQCCFDMMGKLFLDPGDRMAVESPGYLGAIQSYSAYSPELVGLEMGPEGIDPPRCPRLSIPEPSCSTPCRATRTRPDTLTPTASARRPRG